MFFLILHRNSSGVWLRAFRLSSKALPPVETNRSKIFWKIRFFNRFFFTSFLYICWFSEFLFETSFREKESSILVHLIHAGFEFPIRFFRHDRQKLNIIESDGGEIDQGNSQVDELIVGIGETFVVNLPVSWEGDILLRAELMVECKGWDKNKV